MMSLSYIQLINPFPSNLQVTTDSVNPMLLKAIPPSSLQVCSDINSLPSGLTRLVVSSSHCQYSSLATVDLRNHSNLTLINVGDFNYRNVDTFYLTNLLSLTDLTVGSNSFTTTYYTFGLNTARSFFVQHCSSLESITIGAFSFSDYSGNFVLEGIFTFFIRFRSSKIKINRNWYSNQ